MKLFTKENVRKAAWAVGGIAAILVAAKVILKPGTDCKEVTEEILNEVKG